MIRGRSRRRRADPYHGNHDIPARTFFGGLSSPVVSSGAVQGAARHSCRGADLMLPRSHRARHVLASKMTLCSRACGRDWRLGPRRRPFGRYKTSALSMTDYPCQTLFCIFIALSPLFLGA